MVRTRNGSRIAAQGLAGFVLSLLAACAPTVQQARAGLLGEVHGPSFDVAAQRFTTFDGAALGLSSWLPVENAEPWAVIVGLHGMNDYGEAFYLAGPWFAERGVAVYAYDARGFGRSPELVVWGVADLMVEDLRTAISVARKRHPQATLAVVGDSMGAATVISAFGAAAAPRADRVVLVAPAVWGWSTLPDFYAATLWVGAHTFPWRPVSPPRNVRIVASDNTEMLRRIGRDPHMIFRTRIDAVYGLVGLMERASERIGDIEPPVAFLYGAKDQIIPRAAAERAAARLPEGARTAIYANGYHMLMRDLQADVVYADILSFLEDSEATFPSRAPPLETASSGTRQANR